jgi:hypothetical protein
MMCGRVAEEVCVAHLTFDQVYWLSVLGWEYLLFLYFELLASATK